MPMEQKQEHFGYPLNAEAEEPEELVGSLHRRHPRPTKSLDAPSPVFSSNLAYYEKIAPAGSNVSTITNEEEEPEPELVQEQHGPGDGFQVNAGHLVGSAGLGDGVVADVNDGNGIREVVEEELKQSFSFEKQQGAEVTHEHQAAEHGEVGFIASKADLIYEEYDLKEEKPNGREDFHEIKHHDFETSASWKAPKDDVCDLTTERYETQEALSTLNNGHENLSDVRLLSPKKSYREEAEFGLIEVEPEETKYDVERVLENQNTHDLLCPKCRSCITRRVILVRKRQPGPSGGRVIAPPERNVTEPTTEADDPSPDVPITPPVSDIPTDAVEDRRNGREPKVFRCLSCFSFFIPPGEGFKLSWIFGKGTEPGNMPEEPAAVATDNTFVSCFPWNKKSAVPQGPDVLDTTLGQNKADVVNDSLPNQSDPVPSAEDTGSPKPNKDAVESKPSDVIAPSNTVTVVVGPTVISIDQTPVEGTLEDLPIKNNYSKVPEVPPPTQSQSPPTESKVVVVDGVIVPGPYEKVKNDAVKEPEEPTKNITGDSVILPIEREPASQPTAGRDTLTDVENPPQDVARPLLAESRRAAEVPEARDFDILKSVVYGGLVESIASLGVVSSAAGGGAATLNTLALALANLISGLFVLVHHLIELKNEQPSTAAQTQTELEQDRYYQRLGRRGKFSLHATVAVLSFFVFGAVAPITYGFSFRLSDNRDYKLAAVAAASLLCILLLALGKARVSSKSYIKTAIYYLTMGVMASGISFLAGELVDYILEKLGLFESGSSSISVSGVLREMSHSGLGWASY